MQRKCYQYIPHLSEGIKGYGRLPQPVWDDEYIEALETKLSDLAVKGYEVISPTLAERNYHVKYHYEVVVDVPSYFDMKEGSPKKTWRQAHYEEMQDHFKDLGDRYYSLVYEHHGFFKELGEFDDAQPAVLYVFKSPDMAAPLPIMPKEMRVEDIPF